MMQYRSLIYAVLSLACPVYSVAAGLGYGEWAKAAWFMGAAIYLDISYEASIR